MRALLALLLLSQLAAADFLELRIVVEAGKGAKNYENQRKAGETITVSDELVINERHVAEAWPVKDGDRAELMVRLNTEGEERMITATKDAVPGVTRMAVILDGKLTTAPVIQKAPLGKNFVITGTSFEEAKDLAAKLVAARDLAKAASFEIRRVVEPGQGTLKVKVPKTGEELTLSDEVIVNRKDLAKFSKDVEEKTRKIAFELTEDGGKRLAEATTGAEPGKLRLAVLVEGQAITAPVVNSGPLGKSFVVTLGEGEDGKALAEQIEKSLENGK